MIYPILTYIFNWHILPKLLAAYIQYKYTFSKMYIPQPCARRAHRNPPNYIYPTSVGMIYPIPTYIFNWHILPILLAAYIQYKYTFSKIHIPQSCARRAHRNPPTYIHPPSVGMIYPIPTYVFNWHILPKLLAAYIQYKYTFSKMYILQPCARRAHRNPPTYIHPPSVGIIYPIPTYIGQNRCTTFLFLIHPLFIP